MRINIRFAWLLLLSLLGLAACSSPSSPESVAETFYWAVADNKVDKAIAQFDLSNVPEKDMAIVRDKLKAIISETHKNFKQHGGLKKVEPKIENQSGNNAKVSTTLIFTDGTKKVEDTMEIVKGKEGWKIIFRFHSPIKMT